MSQQLTVDVKALADMGKQLNHIKYDLDRVERIDYDAHEFVVDTKIAQALHEFSTNWSDKRQQLSHMIGFAGASALKAAETYDGNDKAASKQQQEQGSQVKQQMEKTGLGAATPVVHTTSGSGDHSASGSTTGGADPTGSTTADVPTDSGSTGSTDAGYTASGDPGTANVPTDTGSGGSLDSGGGDPGSADTSDQNLSADGTLSDSGTVGLSAQASAGGPADHHGGHGSAVTHNAAMAAPVGLLGAAGAAAWASQRRKEKEDESAAEETEV